MAYSEHVIHDIKAKDGITYQVQDTESNSRLNTLEGAANVNGSVAKAVADSQSTLIGNSSTDTASSDTINGAKKYAKELVDDILGEDSAASTLASLKAVIAELNDPANAEGITGTFVDTVKSDLTGLTKTTYYTSEDELQNPEHTAGSIKDAAAHATVKEYVDNAVNGATSGANAAIAALDSTPSQTAADGNGQLTLNLTQVDGVVTNISGSITANTYDSYGSASTVQTTLIGQSTDAKTADTINGAKKYADAAISDLGNSSVTNGILDLAI